LRGGEGHVQEDKETLCMKNGEIFHAEVLKCPGHFNGIKYLFSTKNSKVRAIAVTGFFILVGQMGFAALNAAEEGVGEFLPEVFLIA